MEERKSVFAKFFKKNIKTGNYNDKGLPEFVEKVYIEIRVVNSFDVVERLADRNDIMRFPKEYEMFQRADERAKKGTPLTMFAFLTPAQIECCNAKDIYTIEELSKTSKEKAHDIGLAGEVELAKKFLAVSKNNKAIADFENRIKELETEIAGLRAENDELRRIKKAKGE